MSKAALEAIRTQVMWNRLIAVVEEQAQSFCAPLSARSRAKRATCRRVFTTPKAT